jgi:hypothetical protein
MQAATARSSRALPSGHDRLVSVAAPVEPVTPETRCAVVYDRFRAEADLIAVPVVDGGIPVGLVNRHELTMRLAHDYGRALYAQKPITVLMDAAPLMVESSVEVEALESLIATENLSALMRGFVVTTAGRYAGVATALSLLQHQPDAHGAPQPRGRGSPPRRGERQPQQVPLSRSHEPRAAHALERHHRLLRSHEDAEPGAVAAGEVPGICNS